MTSRISERLRGCPAPAGNLRGLGAGDDSALVAAISAAARPLPPIADSDFASFIDDFADARVILLGESTHGTDEFYRARAAITERLVTRHGFTVVAAEADWPDAARIDAYIRSRSDMPSPTSPFQRFPTWMWRKRAVRDFVDRLQDINADMMYAAAKVGFYGLDLYSLPSSLDAVIGFVERYRPEGLAEVRDRYGCLAPWIEEPAAYGALATSQRIDTCAEEVVGVIADLLAKRMDFIEASDRIFFDALRNAEVVAASEAYYRAMYEGSAESWNLRDRHMFDTLQAVLSARGPATKAVVWAHNSHIGNAAATGMGRQGEINIGQLAKEAYGDRAALIGFGTDRGTVTAATDWGGPAETKRVRPSLPESWGAALRQAGPRYFLPTAGVEGLRGRTARRIERFIGVIYRPETERMSHYVDAEFGAQFDGFVWFEETRAVEPIPAIELHGMPETYPFAL